MSLINITSIFKF